jgi:hypothetical protein
MLKHGVMRKIKHNRAVRIPHSDVLRVKRTGWSKPRASTESNVPRLRNVKNDKSDK